MPAHTPCAHHSLMTHPPGKTYTNYGSTSTTLAILRFCVKYTKIRLKYDIYDIGWQLIFESTENMKIVHHMLGLTWASA